MPAFVPLRICPPYHFDIKRNRQGYWIARDRDGLAGGTFLTCKDAVRFALFETGGGSAQARKRREGGTRRGAAAHGDLALGWVARRVVETAPPQRVLRRNYTTAAGA